MTKPPCNHETLLARIKIPVPQYSCDDCKEKLLLVVPQYGLMTPKEFEEYKREQARLVAVVKRQRETGLVTPDEARQMQAKAKEGKR